MIFKKQSTTYDVWTTLEKVFRDNKASNVTHIDCDLGNNSLGNSSISDYCNKIKSLADRLEHMDSPMPKANLVTYMINGLPQKYRYIAINISNRDTTLSFWDAWSVLISEMDQILQDEQCDAAITHTDHSSSPNALTVWFSNNNGTYNNNSGGREGYLRDKEDAKVDGGVILVEDLSMAVTLIILEEGNSRRKVLEVIGFSDGFNHHMLGRFSKAYCQAQMENS